jgi:hypothetical protein
MDKLDIIGYALIILILIVIFKMYFESESFNLRCIISDVDGKKYCVRESKNKKKTANLLAKITNKLSKLVDITYKKHPEEEKAQRLKKKYRANVVSETLPTSKFTAYSENKGEKLAFCTTKKKNGTEIIDENTLTFVGIHELSHIMSKSIGHNDEFWGNFKFLLKIAVDEKIYNPVDYGKKSIEYCSMKITDNPYFDY